MMPATTLGISGGSSGVESGFPRQGALTGQNWKISNALAGEWVQVVQLEQRLQVYYCTTLIREIDLGIQRSTMVERWIPS